MPWVCALVLLAGSFEWHGSPAAHLPVPASSLADAPLYTCAGGHPRRAHTEPAHAVDRERCAACLHRNQRLGDAVAGLAPAGRADLPSPLPVVRPAALRAVVLDRAPSRGPPAV